MIKKIVISVLALTVLGTGAAVVVYQNGLNGSDEPVAIEDNGQVAPVNNGQGYGQANSNNAQAPTPSEPASDVGDPWSAAGIITEVAEFGMTIAQPDGTSVYVELGPPDFWQGQGVELLVGNQVAVEGFVNEDGQHHAATVTLTDGQQLTLRNEFGQPLWSGGSVNGNGQTGAQDGDHTPEPQAQVDEWVTIEGEIIESLKNNITILTPDGQTIAIQFGQPRFVEQQGIVFNVGQHVIVVGFYQNEQFQVGDITIVETGERLMLRDPNGRPLWAGPGGNGNGNGNGGSTGGNGQ